jgi:diguanylate cyclase (GGDEF)-like protein
LLKLHYTRTRLDTLNEILAMIERALPGARVLPFFFDRWTLLLEGGIAGQVQRDSVRKLIRDLKLDPETLELTVAEGSVAHKILSEGEVVAVEPLTLLSGLTPVRPENVGIQGAIAVPLEVDGECFGLLCAFLPEIPSAEERSKLELIAAHGAIAIRNEHDFDEAQRLNGVDPITWVSNRRTITYKLSGEIDRARRYGHKVGIVLIQVENFIELSQSIGGNRANQLLRRIAMSTTNGVRDPDVIGRYDDAEFLVVLPETDLPGVTVVRDRLMQRLLDLSGEGVDAVSYRAAVACVPDDGWAAPEVLEIAARRLQGGASGALPTAAAS